MESFNNGHFNNGVDGRKIVRSNSDRRAEGLNGQDERTQQKQIHAMVNKKLRERFKRNKINRSILEMEDLVKQSLELSSPTCYKIEKADVLELVVKHLKSQLTPSTSTVSSTTSNDEQIYYRKGIHFCATETMNFLHRLNNSDSHRLAIEVHERLLAMSNRTPDSVPRQHQTFIQTKVRYNEDVAGILLDLSQKTSTTKNNPTPLGTVTNTGQHNFALSSANSPKPESATKREILQKIRSNIFEKRRLRNILRRMPNSDGGQDNEFMWRPW